MRVAFSGSGLLFPVHMGAYLSLLECTNSELTEVAGTSGGSLVAAALALFDDDSVLDIVNRLDLTDAYSYNPTAIFHKGYSYGKNIEAEIDKIFGDYTFGETRIPLYVTASDIVRGVPVVFSTTATPDMRIATALRASISIPLLFTPVEYNDMILVDGSVFDPTPVRAFPKNNERTFGIRIKSNVMVSKYDGFNYILRVVDMLASAVDNMYIDYDDLSPNTDMFILEVPFDNYRVYEIQRLIESGEILMRDKLSKYTLNQLIP